MAQRPLNDWFLSEWMAHFGLRQADISRATGWSKAKASELVNGVTRYNRDLINEAALALNIHPYELLMPPEQANAFRRLHQSALTIVHTSEEADTAAKRSAGS